MIHPLIRRRSSTRAFATRPVEPELLRILFDAARWAPSSFNEQPWRFLLATAAEPEWLAQLQSFLVEGNSWARAAPVLVASACQMQFSRSGLPNRVALRDLGAAEENMFLQAAALGLVMHQMAGFDHERLRRSLLPPGFEPGTLIAIGHPAEPEIADAAPWSEQNGRERSPLGACVFGARWGEPAMVLQPPQAVQS